MKIDFWDVGKGDASVITLPDGQLIVIDVGDVKSPLVDWLRGSKRIVHSFLITHNDRDHAGGLPPLLELAANGDIAFQNIYIVLDRFADSHGAAAVRKLYMPLVKHRAKVKLVSEPMSIWSEGDFDIRIVSDPLETAGRGGTNEKSMIVVLSHKQRNEVTWPGDVKLKSLTEKVNSTSILVGPHHGAPQDHDNETFHKTCKKIEAETLFVSVGSNCKKQPSEKYLKEMKKSETRIVCSQITHICDKNIQTNVFEGTAFLGLEPADGISCRGCFRVEWDLEKGKFISDEDADQRHLEAIQSLESPRCCSPSAKVSTC